MREGGIFDRPSALGDIGALGATPAPRDCIFSPWQKSLTTEGLQREMNAAGASLKLDGLWGSCSESAYRKIVGSPLTKASIEGFFPFVCKQFKNYATNANCTNGSDKVDMAKVEAYRQARLGGGSSTADGGGTLPVEYVDSPCPPGNFYRPGPGQPCVEKPTTTTTTTTKTATTASRTVSTPAASSTPQKRSLIPGVPDVALGIGAGVLVLGGLATAIVIKKRRKAA